MNQSDSIPTNTNECIQQVFNRIDREVWVVTAADGDKRGGLVATWVSAASIDPSLPTMLIALAPNHFTAELVAGSGAFALHLLGEANLELVWHFALASGRTMDKLADLSHRPGRSGSPLLSVCLAWLDCRVIARYDAGDRILFWGEVIDGAVQHQGPPLREKRLFDMATAEQRAALTELRAADIRALAPLRTAWVHTT